MKSYLLRTAWEVLKARIFEAVLARLSESEIQQRSAAPALFEKLESYVEPYAKAFPKAVNFVIAKIALGLVMLSAFFAFFSEALRQFDLLGTLAPSAYLIGYLALLVISSAAFWLVKPPRVERPVAAERALMEEKTAPMATAAPAGASFADLAAGDIASGQSPGPGGLRDISNVEPLHRAPTLSASEVLLNELRSERTRFFGGRA